MKLRIIYACFAMALGFTLILGNSAGRASQSNKGNTGAPGDETLSSGASRTCVTCHGTGSIKVSMDILIADETGASVSAYMPGQTYDVTVRLNHTGGPMPNGYGFQMVALLDSDDSDVNGWSNPASNVKVATASSTGRSYAEQNGVSSTNTFTVKWTAPASDSGNVTFYSCGNGVNDSGTSGGDGAACATLELTEDVDNAIDELSAIGRLKVFPTHTMDVLNVSIENSKLSFATIRILSSNGQEVWTEGVNLNNRSEKTIDVSTFSTGVYFLQVQTKEGVLSRQFVKQ